MGEFECKVADASGRVFQQIEAAQTEHEARQRLSDRGFYVYSVRPRFAILPRAMGRRESGALRASDFLIFNQQFNTLVKAGLPILKALDLLAERAAAPRLRPVLTDVRDRVRDGALLSEAMKETGLFPPVYTTSVLAGEKSGNLSGVLDYYIAYQRVTSGIRRRLLASLVYPSLLIVIAIVIITYIVTYVIPEFARLYTELRVDLPPLTVLLVSLALEFRIYLLSFFGLLAVGGVSAWIWSRSESGSLALDRMKLGVPFLGDIWIKFQVAQFVRTLATLLTGGTPLVAALQTSAEAIGSRLVSTSVVKAASQVREGQSLHASLQATGLMPDLALEMIEVGEATGALAPMLASVAEFYEEDVNIRMSGLLSLVEPLILVFMGIVVAFILISLYLPIFSFSLAAPVR